MEKYSPLEIEKIINECEILFLPENSTIDDAFEAAASSSKNEIKIESNQCYSIEEIPDDNEEDFENIYQKSKASKQTINIPPPTDFSYLASEQPRELENEEENEPNPENALLINRTLKERLLNFRYRVLLLIQKIDDQYHKNNMFLDEAKSNASDNESCFRSSYLKCGAPFFKDALSYPAPLNEDYKFRKNVQKEFFPFDLPPTNTKWKTSEKVALIKGVKQQMVEYIKSQQSRKLCEERKTRNTFQKMKFISHNQDLNESSIIDIYNSIQNDYQDFAINWNLISFNDLQSNHSVSECMGMWFSYLRPDLNREPFTDEENEKLGNIAQENNFKSWDEVASEFDRRSMLQTFVQFQTVFSRLCPSNVRWTEEEDEELLTAVSKYSANGDINWTKVGQFLSFRNKTQCYNRYLIIAKCPTAKRGVFTKEENRAILEYVEQYGDTAFKKLPIDFIPGRSNIQIKNHYQLSLTNKVANPWTREEDRQLMDFVEENGSNSWSAISKILDTHNRVACRTRYLTITNFIKKHPGSTVADVPTKLKKNRLALQSHEKDDSEEVEPTRKIKSIEKFKKQNSSAYELFRTTFKLDFNISELKFDKTKLEILLRMFNVKKYDIPDWRCHQFPPSQMQCFREMLKFNIDEKILAEMKFLTKHTQFLMPPNYGSAVGLRAILIKKHEEPLDETVLPVANPSQDYQNSLLDFQKLYFSLFYWTAMLSKINTSEYNTHFMKYQNNGGSTATNIIRQFNRRKKQVCHKRPSSAETDLGPSEKKAKHSS